NAASSPARHPRPRPQNPLAKSAHQWSVNPHDFEQTMNLVAVVHDSLAQNVLAPGDALAVLVGEEVRGVDSVLYVPALQAHLVFLTVYANGEGEEISFRYYDAAKERVYALTDTFLFSADQVRGMADAPIILRLPFDATTTNTTSEDLRAGYFRAYPNPVNSGQSVTLDFSATPGEKIGIIVTDALGRSLERLELVSPAPENRLEWRPDRLAAGIYTIALRRGFATQTVRLVIK
ncbi:MAG: T9SS type A sorting domain-containing protein, partial [Bacteroidota bacterium]